MKCEKCNQKEATVFFEQTLNGAHTSYHLCAACAEQMKKESFGGGFGLGGDLFTDLFGFGTSARVASAAKSCPLCHTTFATIRREGKVACPKCYETFAEELAPTIRSLHGKATHTGRAPAARHTVRQKKNELESLRDQLRAAIESERYEEAAKLRDQLHALEKEEN